MYICTYGVCVVQIIRRHTTQQQERKRAYTPAHRQARGATRRNSRRRRMYVCSRCRDRDSAFVGTTAHIHMRVSSKANIKGERSTININVFSRRRLGGSRQAACSVRARIHAHAYRQKEHERRAPSVGNCSYKLTVSRILVPLLASAVRPRVYVVTASHFHFPPAAAPHSRVYGRLRVLYYMLPPNIILD